MSEGMDNHEMDEIEKTTDHKTFSNKQFEMIRNNNVMGFKQLFQKEDRDQTEENDIQKLSKNIEISCYNYALHEADYYKVAKRGSNPFFINLYMNRIRSVWRNLQSNELLMKSLLDKTSLPSSLETLSHIELNFSKWISEIEAKTKREHARFNSTKNACTNAYTCRKCKSTKCTFYEAQTRSADEATAVFVTCLDCGKNWKN